MCFLLGVDGICTLFQLNCGMQWGCELRQYLTIIIDLQPDDVSVTNEPAEQSIEGARLSIAHKH